MIPICGLTKTTLLDYPGHIASILFLGGCNFKCPYCHNYELIKNFTPMYTTDEILSFLKKRSHIIEGVCITGGEPTIHKDLPLFMEQIKSLSLKVKLDTNGSNPDFLHHILSQHLVDYIAMDIKTSPTYYKEISQTNDATIEAVKKSVSLLKHCDIPYEFRTTYVKELHTQEHVEDIGNWLKGSPTYYIQNYRQPPNCESQLLHPIDRDTLIKYQTILKTYISTVEIRGE